MASQLSPMPVFKAWDNNGLPLFLGQLFTYAAGTTTPQATYVDSTQTTQNTNPVILNARGEANVWLDPTLSYKFVLQDALGNQIWAVDNIQGTLGVSGNIIPSADNQFSLGNASFRFANGYFATQLYVGSANTPILNGGIVGYIPRTAAEIAAGVTPANYGYPFGHAWRYGVQDNGSTSDTTTAWNNWIAAIKGYSGYLPAPATAGNYYPLPNGFTISAHTLTKITCDPEAQVHTTNAADPFLTLANCIQCDLDFPNVTCAGSGVLITSTNAQTVNNRIGFHRLTGPGKLAAKPTDPMTGTTIGIYVQGPTLGNANYYHLIKQGTYIQNFDTCIAFHTPAAVGGMNANANVALAPHMEGFWFGFYTNSVENRCVEAQFYSTNGTDGSHLAECVRIGDGTYPANFNTVTATSETGGADVRSVNLLANSTGNVIIFQDNEAFSVSDAGSGNTVLVHGSAQFGKPTTFEQGITVGAPSAGDTIDVTAPNAANTYGLNISATGASAQAAKIVGTAAGTPTLVLNSQAKQGSGSITSLTMSTFPGTNAGIAKTLQYLPVTIDGAKIWLLGVPD